MADSPYDLLVLSEPRLVGYWPLNDPSGTTAVDRVFGNNGSIVNNPTKNVAMSPFLNPADVGMSFVAASSQHIEIPNSANYQFGKGDYSIECWFYRVGDPSGVEPRMIERGVASSTGPGYELYHGDGGAYATSRNGTVSLSTKFADWTNGGSIAHHIAVTHQRNNFGLFYIDGRPSGPGLPLAPALTRDVTQNAITYIGCSNDGTTSHWDGWLSKVALYAGVLDPGSIRRHYLTALDVAAPTALAQLRNTGSLWPLI